MTWLLRVAFILLLALTVGWKLAAAPHPAQPGDVARDLADVLQGRLSGPVTGQAWSQSISLYAAPLTACPAPLIVVTAPPDFSAASIVLQMQRPGDHHLFAYADWISPRPDRWRVLSLQAWRKAQSLIGRAHPVNADKLLFIAEPSGCDVARTLPWRRFWGRG